MNKYHKIDTVYKRNVNTKYKSVIEGSFAQPVFEYLKDNQWMFTEKVDGTNVRVIVDPGGPFTGKIQFKGKTDEASLYPGLIQRLQERFFPYESELLANFPDGVCFYGEGYGAKIQKGGGNYRLDQDFVLFDIKVGPWWLQREAIEQIATDLNLDIVPIIGYGWLQDMVDIAKQGFKSTWGDFPAEGIVAKPVTELQDRSGKRVITKIKSKDFVAPVMLSENPVGASHA